MSDPFASLSPLDIDLIDDPFPTPKPKSNIASAAAAAFSPGDTPSIFDTEICTGDEESGGGGCSVCCSAVCSCVRKEAAAGSSSGGGSGNAGASGGTGTGVSGGSGGSDSEKLEVTALNHTWKIAELRWPDDQSIQFLMRCQTKIGSRRPQTGASFHGKIVLYDSHASPPVIHPSVVKSNLGPNERVVIRAKSGYGSGERLMVWEKTKQLGPGWNGVVFFPTDYRFVRTSFVVYRCLFDSDSSDMTEIGTIPWSKPQVKVDWADSKLYLGVRPTDAGVNISSVSVGGAASHSTPPPPALSVVVPSPSPFLQPRPLLPVPVPVPVPVATAASGGSSGGNLSGSGLYPQPISVPALPVPPAVRSAVISPRPSAPAPAVIASAVSAVASTGSDSATTGSGGSGGGGGGGGHLKRPHDDTSTIQSHESVSPWTVASGVVQITGGVLSAQAVREVAADMLTAQSVCKKLRTKGPGEKCGGTPISVPAPNISDDTALIDARTVNVLQTAFDKLKVSESKSAETGYFHATFAVPNEAALKSLRMAVRQQLRRILARYDSQFEQSLLVHTSESTKARMKALGFTYRPPTIWRSHRFECDTCHLTTAHRDEFEIAPNHKPHCANAEDAVSVSAPAVSSTPAAMAKPVVSASAAVGSPPVSVQPITKAERAADYASALDWLRNREPQELTVIAFTAVCSVVAGLLISGF